MVNPKHHHRFHAPLLRSLDSVSGKLFHLRPLDGNPIKSNHAALVSPSPSLSCPSSSSAETIYSRAGVENLGQNKVILHEGKLVVNGIPAIESIFRDDGTFVAQLQQDENVKQPLYFAARLHPLGLGGTAVMGVQPHEDGGARLAESPEVQTFALRAEDDYITTLKFPNLSDPTKPDVSLQVHTGLDKNAAVGFLWYPVPDDASGVTLQTIDAVNATFKKGCRIGLKDGQLSIDIDLRQSRSDLGFGRGSILISADAKSLTGTINQNDADVDFKGTLINGDVTSHVASFVQVVGATSAPSTTLAARTSMLAATVPLSVEDLLNMTPPAGQSVNELSFAKLENLMKNAISDDQRKLLGLTEPPSLSAAEEDVLKMDGMKDFLAGDFFSGYLGQGTVSSDSLTKDFSAVDTPAEKLKWYWQGPGAVKKGNDITNLADIANNSDSGKMDTVLSKDKYYNQANNALGTLAYIELMPRFQLYLARDSSNPKTPEEWATEMYNAASDPDYVNNLAAITSLDTTHSKLNRLSMMLYALDPTKSYASDLTQLVLIQLRVIITENIGVLDPEILTDEKMNSDLLGQLRDYLENGKVGSMGQEALEQWARDYEEASKEIGINDFNQMQDWMLDVSKSAVSLANSLVKLPYWERLGKWQENFAESWPKTGAAFKFASKGMVVLFKAAAVGFAIMSFVGTIENWDKASLSTKVATIASGLELVFKGISMMPEAFEALGKGINGIQNLSFRIEFDNVFSDLSMSDLEMDLMNEEARLLDPELAQLPAEENVVSRALGEVVGEGAEVAVEGEAKAVSRWTQMADISGKIGRAMGIVAGAAVVVAMGIDLAKNWDTMSTLDKTLDIINITAMGIGVIAEGIAFAGDLGVLAGAEFLEFLAEAVVPVVGVVVAVIGLVVTLVLIFTHKAPPPPDTPLDTYIKNIIVPFILTMPQPSADWLKDHKSN